MTSNELASFEMATTSYDRPLIGGGGAVMCAFGLGPVANALMYGKRKNGVFCSMVLECRR